MNPPYEFVNGDSTSVVSNLADRVKDNSAWDNANSSVERSSGRDGSTTVDGGTNSGQAAKVVGGNMKSSSKPAFKKSKGTFRRLPKDPSVVYGRNFEGNVMPISDIIGEIGEVVIRGMVRKLETRPIGNEKSLITFVLTDFTDSIKVKLYAKTIQVDEILDSIKEGSFYMLKGIAMADTYERDITIGSVVGIKTIEDFTAKRIDRAPKKRVELTCPYHDE